MSMIEPIYTDESHDYYTSDQLMFKLNIKGHKLRYRYDKDQQVILESKERFMFNNETERVVKKYTLLNQFNNDNNVNIEIYENNKNEMVFVIGDLMFLTGIMEQNIDFSIFLSDYSFFIHVTVVLLHWNSLENNRVKWLFDQLNGRKSIDINASHCDLNEEEILDKAKEYMNNYNLLNNKINEANLSVLSENLEKNQYTNNSNNISTYFDIRKNNTQITYYPGKDCKIRYTTQKTCRLYPTYSNDPQTYILIKFYDVVKISFKRLLTECPAIIADNRNIDLTRLLTDEKFSDQIQNKVCTGLFSESLFYAQENNVPLNDNSINNSNIQNKQTRISKPVRSTMSQTDFPIPIQQLVEQQLTSEQNIRNNVPIKNTLNNQILTETPIVNKPKKSDRSKKNNSKPNSSHFVSVDSSNSIPKQIKPKKHENSGISDNWLFVIIILILLFMYMLTNYNSTDKLKNNV